MTKHIPWITVLILFCLIVTVKRAEGCSTPQEPIITVVVGK